MTTLYICEKPAQAMDIAKIIGVKRRQDGYLELANGDLISWAVGHLLELQEPGDYSEAWQGRWAWEQLPMIPDKWEYKVKDRTKSQFKTIQKLLKTVSDVVIATDAGREGELIARELLVHAKFKGGVKRFWTSTLTPAAIKHALSNLLPGAQTYPLYEAALARSHADWLLGYTGTRAATLASGVRGDFFAMGRVKTPTLALVVKRCQDVANFKAKTYYELEAQVRTAKGATFKMTHSPKESERIVTKEEAEARKKRAQMFQGPLKVEKAPEKEAPPLPYSLTTLSKDADRILGLSATNTLKVAQALYEKKATSYPRTDCAHLGTDQIPQIPMVLEAVAKRHPDAVGALTKMGVVTRSSTFDDSQLSDHHAIIPTEVHVEDLAGVELQMYNLICLRYLRALGPDAKFAATRVELDANGVLFKASGRATTDPGFKSIKLGDVSADTPEEE